MCGIVGYVGNKNCVPYVIEGLKRLEYRGYDSAGIGVLANGKVSVLKRRGKVEVLEKAVGKSFTNAHIGFGHTRWATHGSPSESNAHPHTNEDSTIAVIHNGIIENYRTLKTMLEKDGYSFVTETDTEVFAHLIDSFVKKGSTVTEALRLALTEIEGTYGLAVLDSRSPDKIIAARKGSPLVLGIGNNENFIASDVSAIVAHTQQVVYLDDGEIAEVYADRFTTTTIYDEKIEKQIEQITVSLEDINKSGYPTFMLKEIMEQPESVFNAMRGRLIPEEGTVKLGGIEPVMNKILNAERIIITACGTSWHAGLVAEYMFEQFLRIPTEVEYASELRYRNPVLQPDDAVFFISQSGETADTFAALKECKRKDALTLGVCNVVGSSIARETDAGVYIHAGPEIGVASTKAFTAQLTVFALITILLARKRDMSMQDGKKLISEFQTIPDKIKAILELNDHIEKISEEFVNAKNFLYLGRGYNFPVALEGALKLKEISYIHAEGYPAAEMKHGPIALVDENMPVVFLAPKDSTYDKIISNIEEVKARKGRIIAVASETDEQIASLADYVIGIPDTERIFMPILSVIPLQLLAYHIAMKKGLNVDQPRNLAKSVTVE